MRANPERIGRHALRQQFSDAVLVEVPRQEDLQYAVQEVTNYVAGAVPNYSKCVYDPLLVFPLGTTLPGR